MNAYSHRQIMKSAFLALPEKFRKYGTLNGEQMADTGNYPDYFDDPTRPPEQKKAIDPEWEKYIEYPLEQTGTKRLHFFPDHLQMHKTGMYHYLLSRIAETFMNGEYEDFVKFMGCFSHAMGDSTQPAHIGPDFENKWIGEMMPVPDRPYLKSFHYHTSVEAVSGNCLPLKKPSILGGSAAEIAWRTAVDANEAECYCRRFIVPTIQALFDNHPSEAERLAAEPVTYAAQLTLNAVYSILSVADGDVPKMPDLDLRMLRPNEKFIDLVYGDMLLDSNRSVPPNDGPFIPGTLLIQGIKNVLPGLGMLPHSGMYRTRDAYCSWMIPSGVFQEFHSYAGLNAEIGNGSVDFQVLLDDQKVYSSGPVTQNDEAKEIKVSLGLAKKLTILVADANEGRTFWTNHAYWGCPILSRT